MTSLWCSCCMQVSVCVCWWFKKIPGRNLSTGDGVFFAVFCCALQGIRKLVIVCFKASNNQTQQSLNVSSGLTVWGLKSCKG